MPPGPAQSLRNAVAMKNRRLLSGWESLALLPTRNGFAIVLLAAIAYCVAARCLVALTWDGSGALFNSLQDGTPHISHYRFSNYPLLLAMIEAGRWTDNGRLLGMFYGLLLAVTPIGSLVLSLWFLRGQRLEALRIWPVIGILLAPLPGEICLMSEASLAVQACWPILCFFLAGAPWAASPWIGLLSVYLLFLHPTSLVLFALCAAVAIYCLGRRPRVIWWVGIFALLSIGRFLFSWRYATGYERAELLFSPNWQAFRNSMLGLPLFLFVGVYLLAIVAFLMGTNRLPSSSARRQIWRVSLCLILVALLWAFYPRLWAGAINYRRFVLACSTPLIGLAALHQRWLLRNNMTAPASVPVGSATAGLSLFAAALFSALYMVQAFSWRVILACFEQTLSAAPGLYVTLNYLPWARETALEHWGSVPLSAILQGREPRVLFAMSQEDIHGAEVFLFPGESLGGKDGWFSLTCRASAFDSSKGEHRSSPAK